MQKRIEAGKPAPALENMPELYEDLEIVWECFWSLNNCRQYGMGPCPLTALEIKTICQMQGVKDADLNETFDLIKRMDAEWLAWSYEQAKK